MINVLTHFAGSHECLNWCISNLLEGQEDPVGHGYLVDQEDLVVLQVLDIQLVGG